MDKGNKSINTDLHGVQQQIPRNSLILIMLAQAAVVIPHIQQLSVWIILLGLGCAYWRWQIFRDRLPFPKWWLKALLTFGTGAIILVSEGIQHRLETWTSFLIVAFALKLIETKTRRDAYAVIFLACFVIVTEFIYSQTILTTLYQCAALIIVIAAMVGMNQFHTRINILSSIKLAGKLIAQALPLMLVLFVLFPRITPFWWVPSASTARTGLSSELTPGDIARLAHSDEIAFRAVFEKSPPPPQELYWRALVFSNFYAGTWSLGKIPFLKSGQPAIDWANDDIIVSFVPEQRGSKKISYQILQEPTENIWRFGLDLAIPRPGNSGLTWDFRIVTKKPMSTLTHYAIDSYPEAMLDKNLPPWLQERETRLPAQDNSRIIEYAQQLYARSNSNRNFIDTILRKIREGNFRYTLKPPILDRNNSVDQFWFDTQAGFCMHYAGALTYMLRSVHIPARVVGGYQGGEINPITGHVVVRQYHAHAWVEAWLPGEGWQRFDPTAVIAPERVEQGLEAALTDEERDALSTFTNMRLGQVFFAARMLHLFESFEHRWNMFVVGYDTKRQSDTLQKLLGEVTPLRVALVLLLGGGISLILAGLSIFMQHKSKAMHPVVKLFQHFSNELSAKGLTRQAQESPMQFIQRIGSEKKLEKKNYIPLAKKLQKLLYSSTQPNESVNMRQLRKEFTHLKRILFTV